MRPYQIESQVRLFGHRQQLRKFPVPLHIEKLQLWHEGLGERHIREAHQGVMKKRKLTKSIPASGTNAIVSK
jgi:hypothetical protein